jgi:Protein of unknown function (DUF1059)
MDGDFVAKGETNEDIMQQAAEHARTAHNMTEFHQRSQIKFGVPSATRPPSHSLPNLTGLQFTASIKDALARAPFPLQPHAKIRVPAHVEPTDQGV